METNNKNVIVLALLIIGVSFFYANLGGSSGAVTRYTDPIVKAEQNEWECAEGGSDDSRRCCAARPSPPSPEVRS